MLEKFIFENHLGIRFVGLESGVYLNYNDLRDYAWSYDTINNRISRFFMGTKNRKIPLVVKCRTDEEAVAVKNRLHELAETDIEAKIPGKIFVGDFYTTGYITSSVKSDYLVTKQYCRIDLTLTSDDPTWYREKPYSFIPGNDGAGSSGEGIDYPYDYAYDYGSSQTGKIIVLDAIRGSAFRLKIYGEVTNPTVMIAGHAYSINGAVGKGEMLLIDSLRKTITLTTATGAKINWFDKRSRDSYIFQPIPPGQNSVNWNGAFGFDLTVIEKRSEPKWT